MHEQYIEYHQIIDSFVSENDSNQRRRQEHKAFRSSADGCSQAKASESKASDSRASNRKASEKENREDKIRKAFIRVLNEEIRDLLGKP